MKIVTSVIFVALALTLASNANADAWDDVKQWVDDLIETDEEKQAKAEAYRMQEEEWDRQAVAWADSPERRAADAKMERWRLEAEVRAIKLEQKNEEMRRWIEKNRETPEPQATEGAE